MITVILFYIFNIISQTFSHNKGNFYNLKSLILLLDIKTVYGEMYSGEYITLYYKNTYLFLY